MVYADFEFYSDSFLGLAISEADFPRLALRASQFLDYYTQGKAEANSDLDAVKMACCALAEQYQIIEKAAKIAADTMTGENAVKSESVGSYSVSYQTASEASEKAVEASEKAQANLARVARQYLAWSNLLYRGRC